MCEKETIIMETTSNITTFGINGHHRDGLNTAKEEKCLQIWMNFNSSEK